MNWYKKSQADNATLVLIVMMQKASQPGYMFEEELLKFQDYEPKEIEAAVRYAYTQFQSMNEQQQNILWHLQRMITGMDGVKVQEDIEDTNDQEAIGEIPGEEPILNIG